MEEARYERQQRLPFIGAEEQARLSTARVAIVGVGALGSVCAELLARAGVGTLILFDDDRVELSNLQRQALYTERDVGQLKVAAARRHVLERNSGVRVDVHARRIDAGSAPLLSDAEVLLDCSDNLATSLCCNDLALQLGIPLVFCGVAGTRGRLYVVERGRACLRCIFSPAKIEEGTADAGVLNSTTYSAAALQVVAAIKILLGIPGTEGLLSFDVWQHRCEDYRVRRRASCSCARYAARKAKS